MTDDQLRELVIGCCIKIHSALGPGLLESAYHACLAYELRRVGLAFEQEKPMPLLYEQVRLDVGYRLDFWIEDRLLVEIKAVEALAPIHIAQVLTYLKLAKQRYGLLINFNVTLLKSGGIKKVVNGY